MRTGLESESDEDSGEAAEAREIEELKKLNLDDDEIIKQIELRRSEKLALKLQREEERELSKTRTDNVPVGEVDIGTNQDEESPLKKSERLALQLQREQEEEESLALARALQEEEEREARYLASP